MIPGGDDRLWTLGSYRDAQGRALASFTGRKLRQWPPRFGTARAAEAPLGPGPRRPRPRAARRARLPRHLPARDEARPPRRARLPDRGQPALVAVDRPRDRLRGQPAPPRAGCDAIGRRRDAARRAPQRAALDPRDQAPRRAAPARSAAGEWTPRRLRLARCARPSGRRPRPARPAPGARALRRATRAPAPWLSPAASRIGRGVRPAFAPRARWVLETLAEALGATPVWTRRPGRPGLRPRPARRRASGSRPTRPPRPSSRATRAFPATAVHRAAGLTLLFPPSHPERPDPRRHRGERLLPAGPLGRAARPRARPLRPAAAGGQRLRPHRGARPGGARRRGRTSPRCGAARRCRRPTAWEVALTHDIDRIRRRTPKGLAGIARRRGPRGLAAALAGPDPWDNVPDLLEAAWLRGARPTVFLIGRNAHPLDGTPRRTYERERARDGRGRARRGRRGGPARGVRLVGGRRRPGAPSSPACGPRSGPVTGVRFHYLRFRYHETRALARGGRGRATTRASASARRRASPRASPAPSARTSSARSGPRRPHAAAAGGDGHDAPLAPRPGRGGRPRARAARCSTACATAGGRVALLWHNTYLADDRAPGYGALWGDLLDELAARGARLGPAGIAGGPRGGRAPATAGAWCT